MQGGDAPGRSIAPPFQRTRAPGQMRMRDIRTQLLQRAPRLPLRQDIPDHDHTHVVGYTMGDRIGPVFSASLAQDQGDIVALRRLRIRQFNRMTFGAGEAAGQQYVGDGQRRVGHS